MPSKTTQTAFRLNVRDLAIIDHVKDRESLTTRTEALRFLLRAWEKSQNSDLRWSIANKAKRK